MNPLTHFDDRGASEHLRLVRCTELIYCPSKSVGVHLHECKGASAELVEGCIGK